MHELLINKLQQHHLKEIFSQVRFSDASASPRTLSLSECRGEAHIYATVEVRAKEKEPDNMRKELVAWQSGRETRLGIRGVEEGRRVPPPPPALLESREAAPLPLEPLGSRCPLDQHQDFSTSRTLVPSPSPCSSASPSHGSNITLKVYAKCLGPDIEYKTVRNPKHLKSLTKITLEQVIVAENMSSRELVWLLLSKYRMRHRDPKVCYH